MASNEAPPEFYAFIAEAKALAKKMKWREGQAFFNLIEERRPDLAAKIRGTVIDPFQAVSSADKRYRACMELLKKTWEKK